MQNLLMKTRGKLTLDSLLQNQTKTKKVTKQSQERGVQHDKKRKEEIVSNSLENKSLLEFSITQQHKTKCPCKTPLDKGKQHRRAHKTTMKKTLQKIIIPNLAFSFILPISRFSSSSLTFAHLPSLFLFFLSSLLNQLQFSNHCLQSSTLRKKKKRKKEYNITYVIIVCCVHLLFILVSTILNNV